MPLDADTVRSVLVALGRPSATATHLGEGFASDAWLVRDGDARLVLRIERPDAGYPNSYRLEHERMAALVERGAVVPTPVAGSWEVEADAALAYSLTTYLAGSPTSNEALAGLVEQVASFLRILHALPATGDRRTALIERFDAGIWPIGGRPLAAHPALADRPALRARVERHAAAVHAAIARPPLVLVHSDLHEENMLFDGERLAFIDFGETFVGAAGWEFASMAYFTSWDLADAVLVRYLDDPAEARRLARRGRAPGPVVRAVPLGAGHRHGARHRRLQRGVPAPDPGRIETATIGPMEIMGVQIRTIVHDNVASRCDGCLEIIDGTPWRVNLLDIVASESPVAWTERPTINPGPFQFHGEPACVRRWMAGKGYLFCRRGEVREILRPIAIPGETVRWGLCDGIHRDDHEFVPA